MRPIAKWNARVNSARDHPRGRAQGVQGRRVREARRHAPGAARGRHGAGRWTPRRCRAARPVQPEPGAPRAASGRRPDPRRRSTRSRWPATAPSAPARPARCASSSHTTGIPVAETFMGKGLLDYEDPRALGHRRAAVARLRDGRLRGRRRGHRDRLRPRRARARALEPAARQADRRDRHRRRRDRRVLHARGRADRRHRPRARAAGRGCCERSRSSRRARSGCATSCCGALHDARDDDHFPMRPPRVLWDIRQALGREDMLVSDVGLHKLWIGRMFPAHEPGTVLIANGLAGMGFALPTAIAAKLVHPDRKRRHGQRRRRLPDELPGARDRGAAEDAGRQRHLGEPPVRLDRLEAGQEVRRATSASTSATPTSSSSPSRSAMPAWRCAAPRSSRSCCATR